MAGIAQVRGRALGTWHPSPRSQCVVREGLRAEQQPRQSSGCQQLPRPMLGRLRGCRSGDQDERGRGSEEERREPSRGPGHGCGGPGTVQSKCFREGRRLACLFPGCVTGTAAPGIAFPRRLPSARDGLNTLHPPGSPGGRYHQSHCTDEPTETWGGYLA